MSEENAASAPVKTGFGHGIRTVLVRSGIPASWLTKRPKLPSRNWLIFLSVTSSFAGLYIYDRRQCKRIRQDYVDRVKHLADEPLDVLQFPRKVTVYGCKWPGDEEYDQSMKYFRKYVKPVLVAAAVDYEMVNGKRHGDLAERIAEDIRNRRRLDLGLDKPPDSLMALPTAKSPEEKRKQELEGGIVIIGRPTFKEFMAGLKRGWTDSLAKVDKDELLARELEADGRFDEPDEPPEQGDEPLGGTTKSPVVFSPLQFRAPSSPTNSSPAAPVLPPHLDVPPAQIPPMPPLLLVSFTNYIGFTKIPLMIWDWFNERHRVLAGAQAGYRLVSQQTRPFIPPTDQPKELFADLAIPNGQYALQGGDLDFECHVEGIYKKSLSSIPDDIEKARQKYYGSLPAKLEVARALARGTREPTKEEVQNPPPTEVELRAERLKKEQRWRGDLAGWEIVRPGAKVAWDERIASALRVFVDPSEDNDISPSTPTQPAQ